MKVVVRALVILFCATSTYAYSVNQGDVIGYEGATGFATGPHLHFEVRANGSHTNPRDYLGGMLIWPMSNYRITQEYGPASWTAYYSFHTGIDLASNDGYGAPIFAAATGNVILQQYYGGYGNTIVIDHGEGLMTLYGHLADFAIIPEPSSLLALGGGLIGIIGMFKRNRNERR